MTSIAQNRLVNKNHPRIIFRGALDSFLAELFRTMIKPCIAGCSGILNDFITIKDFMRELQAAEVRETYLEEPRLIGLTLNELREHSHNPQKYYKTGHLFQLDHNSGETVIEINYLRTKARELEIKAFDAYYDGQKLKREDISKALNRLSSALYIMELKATANMYGK